MRGLGCSDPCTSGRPLGVAVPCITPAYDYSSGRDEGGCERVSDCMSWPNRAAELVVYRIMFWSWCEDALTAAGPNGLQSVSSADPLSHPPPFHVF